METSIYFEWTHKKEHVEKTISVKLINQTLEKYNWKLESITSTNKMLSSCYEWYIVSKI